MPRGPRLDAPGLLHHVMVRGSERRPIFRDDRDRREFVTRLAAQAQAHAWAVYAWTLLWGDAAYYVQLRLTRPGGDTAQELPGQSDTILLLSLLRLRGARRPLSGRAAHRLVGGPRPRLAPATPAGRSTEAPVLGPSCLGRCGRYQPHR